ncbi:hypothetical protein [Limosilactobacillus mucosae]|uniref:Uncharacterized protein n=1 Tax=Limosilactobacillus mucosae TaxID=97478 RepID=A0AAJ1HQV8_LIMMU|nr:hypothetical protein [Limosilactobacillus mucosae]MDC2828513.1 hypothetical protein [Limosilactobacillus mucosae]MDC2834525.1 hypothetical protein [Limosilactobacillus mucosae]
MFLIMLLSIAVAVYFWHRAKKAEEKAQPKENPLMKYNYSYRLRQFQPEGYRKGDISRKYERRPEPEPTSEKNKESATSEKQVEQTPKLEQSAQSQASDTAKTTSDFQLEVDDSTMFFDPSSGELLNWSDINKPTNEEIYISGKQAGFLEKLEKKK